MAYDLEGPWDPVNGYNAPLNPEHRDVKPTQKQLNAAVSVAAWIQQGAPRHKLVLGVPFYGHTFTLANPAKHAIGENSSGPGIAGQYSQEAGTIGYMELSERMHKEKGAWTQVWNDVKKVPYAYANKTWVSYDNVKSIGVKAQYAKDQNLGGVMVWSLEWDDFRGLCGEKYPLTINRVLSRIETPENASNTPNAPSAQISARSGSTAPELNKKERRRKNINDTFRAVKNNHKFWKKVKRVFDIT